MPPVDHSRPFALLSSFTHTHTHTHTYTHAHALLAASMLRAACSLLRPRSLLSQSRPALAMSTAALASAAAKRPHAFQWQQTMLRVKDAEVRRAREPESSERKKSRKRDKRTSTTVVARLSLSFSLSSLPLSFPFQPPSFSRQRTLHSLAFFIAKRERDGEKQNVETKVDVVVAALSTPSLPTRFPCSVPNAVHQSRLTRGKEARQVYAAALGRKRVLKGRCVLLSCVALFFFHPLPLSLRHWRVLSSIPEI